MKNPLIARGRIPDFRKIRVAHFLPALDAALAKVTAHVARIKRAPASFQNTIVPLDSLFEEVGAIMRILGNLTANAYTKELAKIDEKASIRVAAMKKTVFQDKELGRLFRQVYDARGRLKLDEDDKAILKHLHQSFEQNGALLTPAGQKKIRKIDEQLISLAQKFTDNMRAAPEKQAILITDRRELAGLSPGQVDSFAADARRRGKKGWLVTPERLLVDELLERAENASFRKKIFDALNGLGTKAPHDNRPVIKKMLQLRHEYAQLVGYKHYADFARSRMMKTDLREIRRFLSGVGAPALKKFDADMRALEIFSARNGGPLKLKPWDVSHWATRQRQALYHFDANGFSKYLELGNVLNGLFAEAGHVFGLKFGKSAKYPTMHPDIQTFDVRDNEGREVGILHIDVFARPGVKGGGAWMGQIQAKAEDRPNIVIFNMNIAKPTKGQPALVGVSQYVTFYHEMGHALHGLLGTNVKYPSLLGTAAPKDYVEFHSTVNEHRALLKKNLQAHALHVDTGRPAPRELIDALVGSKAHFEARNILKLVQNSLRDIAFHSIDPKKYQGDAALEKSVALKSPYADHIRAYPLARFDHLFGDAHSTYAAGYVNYLIAQEHADDGFEPFEKAPYAKTWSKRLAELYRRGAGGDPSDLYREYRGRDATPAAMLRGAGIVDGTKRKRA